MKDFIPKYFSFALICQCIEKEYMQQATLIQTPGNPSALIQSVGDHAVLNHAYFCTIYINQLQGSAAVCRKTETKEIHVLLVADSKQLLVGDLRSRIIHFFTLFVVHQCQLHEQEFLTARTQLCRDPIDHNMIIKTEILKQK